MNTGLPTVDITCSITCRCGLRVESTVVQEAGNPKYSIPPPVEIVRLATESGWRWFWRWWLCPSCAKDRRAQVHPPAPSNAGRHRLNK